MMNDPNLRSSLSVWQARQAAMLYYYSSLDYLKQLHALITRFESGVADPLLTLAETQDRDAVLSNAQWGERNTSENWANNAWPMLKDLQVELAKDIALRKFNKYKITSVNDCLKGIEQYSMNWTTEQEEREFRRVLSTISAHARRIDSTLDERAPHWDDYGFSYELPSFVIECPRIGRFQIRSDLIGQTGQLPPRTGVYVSADDPEAALQFAAAGPDGLCLRQARTFNEIGLAALSAVGRPALWFDEEKMLKFAVASRQSDLFMSNIRFFGKEHADLAPSAVARHAFTERPSKWYYVEHLDDDFEDSSIPVNLSATPDLVRRLASGESCDEPGFYFSPANTNSRRYFKSGEIMPAVGTGYGNTIWQWDLTQS